MKTYIVLGDWSDDGHGKYDKILCDITGDLKSAKLNFIKACQNFKVSFDVNDEYLNVTSDWGNSNDYRIACEYGDRYLPVIAYERFLSNSTFPKKFNKNSDNYTTFWNNDYGLCLDKKSIIEIIFWLVSTVDNSFSGTIIDNKDTIPVFNGYWDKDLNIQIGYGLYD